MNLTGDPWIPVLDDAGHARLMGLAQVFGEGHRIRDLCVTPPQRIALMRLLVCIAQASLKGPDDEAEWLACRERMVPAALRYLERWRDRFELYGDRPFLQVAELEPARNATLDKLGSIDAGLAAGNSPTLFDHGAEPEGRPRSPAWCALMLLTYQCFSPGGTIGDNRWGGRATGRSSKHAPCVEESALHTLLRGACLLQSVHLNLLTRELVAQLPNGEWGVPIWEGMPPTPGSPAAQESVRSYLGRLVPLARAVRLESDSSRFTLANGLSYPKLPAWREPAATVVLRGRGANERLAYLKVDLAKHPWRELGSLLALASGTQGGPVVVRHIASLRQRGGIVDVWTGGLAASRGKLIDVGEWVFAVPVDMVDALSVRKYQEGVAMAEQAAFGLWRAVTAYCGALQASDTLSARAAALYWGALDAEHGLLLEVANDSARSLGDDWYQRVCGSLRMAYERVCDRVTPRQLQAYVAGRRHLYLANPDAADKTPKKEEAVHARA